MGLPQKERHRTIPGNSRDALHGVDVRKLVWIGPHARPQKQNTYRRPFLVHELHVVHVEVAMLRELVFVETEQGFFANFHTVDCHVAPAPGQMHKL